MTRFGLAIWLVCGALGVGPAYVQAFTPPYSTETILGREFGSVSCGGGLALDRFGGWYLPIISGAKAPDFELDVCHQSLPVSGSIPITGSFTQVSDLPASWATIPIQGHLTAIPNPTSGVPLPACFRTFALDFSGHNGVLVIQSTTPTTVGPILQPPYGAVEVRYRLPATCEGSTGGTVGGVVAIQVVSSPGALGTWSATGSLAQDRANGASVLLNNGTVLVAGGNTNRSVYLNSAEIYDPSTGTWSLTGSMHVDRNFFTATLLIDGDVLVAGGAHFDPNGNYLSEVELYRHESNSWSVAEPMSVERSGHTATRLRDGRVLVAGGASNEAILASAEIYDPGTGLWAATASMSTPRAGATATLLANGEVLVAGGSDHFDNGPFLTSAEIYNPDTGSWHTAGHMLTAHHTASAELLFNGDVFIVGGYNLDLETGVDIYHPATNSWSAAPPYFAPVRAQSAVVLRNCQVLVAGGLYFNADQTQVIVEPRAALYDPISMKWLPARDMLIERAGASATLLPDGEVLVAGGDNNSGTLTESELFSLPSEQSTPNSGDCDSDK